MSEPTMPVGRSPPLAPAGATPLPFHQLRTIAVMASGWPYNHSPFNPLHSHTRQTMCDHDSTHSSFDLSSIASFILPSGNLALASQAFTPSSILNTMTSEPARNADFLSSREEPALSGVLTPFGPRLIRVRYGRQPALDSGPIMMRKVPAHFDLAGLQVDGPYALHTDYAGKSRSFDSPLLEGLNTLKASHRRGVPELWSSPQWSEEFGQFIFRLIGSSAPPNLIEIHPPFTCTTPTVEEFFENYGRFEAIVRDRYSACEFVIENRSGSKHPSPFLVSDVDSIVALGQALASCSLNLRIALDLPQVFTSHWGSKQQVGMEGLDLVQRLSPIRAQIHTLHLWGRGPGGGAHSGGLDGLFAAGTGAKEACLRELCQMLDDGGPDRHLVLEVSRQSDVEAILADLESCGFEVG